MKHLLKPDLGRSARRGLTLGTALFLTLATELEAQATWTQVMPTASPPAGGLDYSMAFDSARNVVLLRTGSVFGVVGETFEYDGSSWQPVITPTTPTTGGGAALTFDSARSVIVMHGGAGPGFGVSSETWEYDGTDWTLATSSGPGVVEATMTFDASTGKSVLFGGSDLSGNVFTNTWEYDGTNWTQAPAGPSPDVFNQMAFAYDPTAGKSILFGGQTTTFAFSDQTWEYDSVMQAWTLLSPLSSPAPRRGIRGAFSAAAGGMITHGGTGGVVPNVMTLADSWVYDSTANDWIELVGANGPAIDTCQLAYDSLRGATVLFGGFKGAPIFQTTDETWELGGSPPSFDICNGDGGDQMGCTDYPCGNNTPQGTAGGCINSAGTSSRLLQAGTSGIAAADLRFEASGVAPSNSCVLTSGNSLAPANMANPCFGLDSGIQSVSLDGLRCVVQGVLRHGVRPSDANGDVGVTTNGWGTPNGFFQFSAFMAGDTKHFQIIHRDNAGAVCQTGQNTSQARSVTFVP